MATAKKQLEEETIARVDLENKLQSMKEDLAFKTQIHEQVRNGVLCTLTYIDINRHIDIDVDVGVGV